MKTTTARHTRVISFLLLLALCVSLLPGTARAAANQLIVTFAGQKVDGAADDVQLKANDFYNNPKVLMVEADYTGTTTKRNITVDLAGGLDFSSIPGMKRSGNTWTFDETTLPLDMKGVIEDASVTYKTQALGSYTRAYAPTLTITLADSAVSLNTGNMLQVRPDPDWLWAETVTVDNAITVTSDDSAKAPKTQAAEKVTIANGYGVCNLNSFGAQVITSGMPAADYPAGENPYYVPAGAQGKAAFFLSARYVNGNAYSGDFKNLTYTFLVPKALGLTGVNIPTSDYFTQYGTTGTAQISSYDSEYDQVTLNYTNLHLTYDGNYKNTMFELVFTPPTPEADFAYDKNYYYITSPTVSAVLPDGTTQDIDNHIRSNPYNVYNGSVQNTFRRARPESPLLSIYDRPDVELQIAGVTPGSSTQLLGDFNIQNDTVKAIDGNTLTYDFPTDGVVVRSYHVFSDCTGITVKLSNGKSYTVPDKTDNAVISVADILAAAGETDDGTLGIDTITCTLPSVATSERSNININGYLTSGTGGGKYYGYVTNTALTDWKATVTASNGTDSATGTTTTTVKPTENRRIITYLPSRDFVSGKTYSIRAYAYNDGYERGTEGDANDFTFYLREDEYLTYDVNSMVLGWNGNTYQVSDGTLTATKLTDTAGLTYYAVKPTTDQIDLRYFNDKGNQVGWSSGNAGASAMGAYLDVKLTASTEESVTKKSSFFLRGGADGITYDPRWTNYFVDNSDFKLGDAATLSSHNSYLINIAPSTDFIANTAGSTDGAAWQTYTQVEGSTEYVGQLIITDDADTVDYRATLKNNTIQTASGCSIMIPIPKEGGNVNDALPAGSKLQGQFQGVDDDFGFTLNLEQEISIDGCTVRYCTDYNVDPNAATWKTWDQISDKSSIKMVDVQLTESLEPEQQLTFSFPMALPKGVGNSVLTEDGTGLKVDTYAAAFQRSLKSPDAVIPTSGIVPTEFVSMVLKLGKISGNVWLDQNKNGKKDAGSDLPYAGAAVQLVVQEADGTETLVSTATTDQNGNYSFSALQNAAYTVRVVNPNADLYIFITPDGADSHVASDTGEAESTINDTTRSQTVNAGLSASVVKLTLDPGDGTIPAGTTNPIRGMAGGPVPDGAIPDAVPAKTNEDFLGWFDADGNLVDDGSLNKTVLSKFPQGDTTLYAKYVPKRTVTYVLAGGNVGGSKTDIVWKPLTNNTTLGSFSAIPAPAREGYTLLGWQTEDGSAIILPDKMADQLVTKDTTYTAYWLQNNAEIVFNANGTGATFYNPTLGSDSPTEVSYTRPDQYTMFLSAASKPVREGYVFTGWAERADAATPTDKESVVFESANSPKTYYAVWTPATYTVNLYYNGGQVGTADGNKIEEIPYQSTLGTVAQPTAPSGTYRFDGWMDMNDPSIILTTADLGKLPITSDRSFVALWTQAPYKVTFNTGTDGVLSGGGTVDTSEYGALDQAKLAVPTVAANDGKVFTGWKVVSTNAENEKDGLTTGAVFTQEELYEVAVKGDLEFEAVYAQDTIRVIFTPNGGILGLTSQDRQTINYGTAPKAVTVYPAPGHTLLGWLNTSTGEMVSAEKIDKTTLTQDTVYVAQWETNHYKLSFDVNRANGGAGENPATVENPYGATYAIAETAAPADTVRNYFLGWYTKPVGGVAITQWNFTSDTTVYAHYAPVGSFLVTFEQGRGGTLEDNPTTEPVLTGGTVTVVPAVTVTTGKVFIGWKDDINTGLYDDIAVKAYPITRATTFTAQYADDADAIVIFNYDGGTDGEKGYTLETGTPGKTYGTPTPTRDGYVFAGWDKPVVGTFGKAASITTYTAQWTPKYTVTFEAGIGGDMTPAEASEIVVSGDKVSSVPTIAAKTGYRFLNYWTCDGTQYTAREILALPITANKTFTAAYEAIYHTLTFVSSGSAVEPVTVLEGTTIALSAYQTSKAGWLFDAWCADKTLQSKLTEVTMDQDYTVYGRFSMFPSNPHYAYVIGYPDGTVHPNGHITRAETATIFFRLLDDSIRNANLTEDNNFTDVNKGDWFDMAVSTLAAMGIINGRTTTTFDPKATITRAEFATIAARFSDVTYSGPDMFSDISDHWAKSYINEAANLGWINGYQDGTFHPDQAITRAEAFTMVNRVTHRLPETTEDLVAGMNTFSDNLNPADWYYLAIQEATNSHECAVKDDGIHEMWIHRLADRDWSKLYEK